MSVTVNKDVVIIGGGIAGLWLLDRLVNAGFNVNLLESHSLGYGQTIASQGIIHGGVKYALGGSLTRASQTIADMPAYWESCISGQGEVNLHGIHRLSPSFYLWPKSSIRSRITAFLGSKTLHGRIENLTPQEYPDFFQGHISGPLYQLSDPVLDIPTVISELSHRHHKRIHLIDWQEAGINHNATGEIDNIDTGHGQELKAKRYIFTAGEGTRNLLKSFNLESPPMQVRPLHMVMVRHKIPAPVFVHCLADNFSTIPDMTITTHSCRDGSTIWYIGGALAEKGIGLSQDEQLERARNKLTSLFTWCDFTESDWVGFRINRAEPEQQGGQRPDNVFLDSRQNFMVCWPTKLTLAPVLANLVLEELTQQAVLPVHVPGQELTLPFPGIAETPWDTAFS